MKAILDRRYITIITALQNGRKRAKEFLFKINNIENKISGKLDLNDIHKDLKLYQELSDILKQDIERTQAKIALEEQNLTQVRQLFQQKREQIKKF
jgi:hypothetical protein